MPLEPSDSLALPAACYAIATPSAARAPRLRAFNDTLADELSLESDGEEALAARYSGLRVPDGLTPLALAYAGHQFGHFVPQLGDGRAILLGTATREDGARFDVQLKGAGRTPFSRRGDGRSSLGPVVREFLLSEAMHALGVPTTRALAAVETGETVLREDELPGAILTRVASSHVRVGTFEFFAARRMHTELEAILDFAIARHHPDLVGAPGRAIAFFERVCEATMRLVARWMSVGFIHGVMNTDNTTVSGETLDYGPCAFMDTFRWDKVYSSIDQRGRYRYSAQPQIAAWNLAVLGSTLMPLAGEGAEAAVDRVLDTLEARFERAWLEAFAPKLGLLEPSADDHALIRGWLDHLEAEGLDFTNSFRTLDPASGEGSAFHEAWRARLLSQAAPDEDVRALMRAHNPALIPRNHLVERAITSAREGDWSVFERLRSAWERPFEDQPDAADLTRPPEPHEIVYRTFCGT